MKPLAHPDMLKQLGGSSVTIYLVTSYNSKIVRRRSAGNNPPDYLLLNTFSTTGYYRFMSHG